MKKYFAFLLLIGAVSITLIALADSPPVNKKLTTPPADVQALKNQIAELQSRVQQLEDQTKSLESTVANLQKPPMIPLFEQPHGPLSFKNPLSDSPSGKIWGQKQVNGWTVYIVPCEQGK